MPSTPLAYFITIGTYGTRLHGDPRGTVDRENHTPGDPFLAADPARSSFDAGSMSSAPTRLDSAQQELVESIVPQLADELGWTCHVVSAAPNHVHALISAEPHGHVVRRLLKRRLSQALSDRWPVRPAATWWAEGGSVKWIWNPASLRAACEYIADQRRDERAL